jgi:SAM-dependent MidA family methyltransferase
MGINTRVDILSKAMTKENKERLESEADRLTNPDEMGEIYKVQLVTRV